MKSWYTSKTLWFNFIGGLSFVATHYFGYKTNFQLEQGLVNFFSDPIVLSVGNLFLRLVTHKAVTFTPAAPQA